MDAALIARECVDTRLRGMDPGMGFGSRWLKRIEFCIKTTRFLILVNGESAGFFQAERGLIQGDPPSPFLFIVAMEDFNSILKIAAQNIWLQGFRIGKWADV
ncbi:uncharacterized mitochondrial protein AtMg01250-like [Solanum dulcamara]|uniref:uncharacterized mitochondrial protein AtMg01250-like n=1 Tax=Solanum dulcamara TaxID=45834 RepID=UPI00248651C1|nr:uncharacterized mitochondrial protein AtMg01250-like [Solanum dulcamara]